MNRYLPLVIIPLAVGCTSTAGRDTTSQRDLSLPTVDTSAVPAVLSDIERGTLKPQATPVRRQVRRSATGAPAAVAAPVPDVSEVTEAPALAAVVDPVPDPVPVKETPAPAPQGIGTPLAAGETVTIIPASADGGGVRGRGEIAMGGRGSSGGIMFGGDHDNCAPTRGTVIAVNRPYARIRPY